MDKEEILEKSRTDNKAMDEREKQLRKFSAVPALIAIVVSGFLLMIAEFIFLDTEIILYGLPLMVQSAICVQSWYIGLKLKKKIYLILAILWIPVLCLSCFNTIVMFRSMM